MHLIGYMYYWHVSHTKNIYFAQKKQIKNDLKKHAHNNILL